VSTQQHVLTFIRFWSSASWQSRGNSTRHCGKPGTTLCQLSAKCFSCCSTVWLWWHLLPSSTELLTDPQRVTVCSLGRI